MEPIFLTPYFRPKIWGGRKLNTIFNYDIPEGKVGEAWIISGYKDDASTVTEGPLKGKTLREVYHEHSELFGNPKSKEFPLLVKFLDANDNLSVQVHPDDDYAHKVEEELKKNDISTTVDSRSEKIGYKIREARLDRLPYMLVVGQQEEADNTVSVRSRFAGDEGAKTLDSFIAEITEEIKNKTIRQEVSSSETNK